MTRERNFLVLITLTLILIGVLMVFSSGFITAARDLGITSTEYLLRQGVYTVLALAVLYLFARFDYHKLSNRTIYVSLFWGTLALLVGVLVFGEMAGGAQRAFRLGPMGFQPSEIAKLSIIIILAVKLAQNNDEVWKFWEGLAPLVFLTGILAAFVLAQRDLGTPVLMCGVAGLMLFVAGARWKYAIGGAASMIAITFTLIHVAGYRSERWDDYIYHWLWGGDGGYQLSHSLNAFAFGSITGRGPGASEQKLGYLPAAHNDFIFAIFGEEMGLVGTLFVVALFTAMLALGVRIALHARDFLGSMLACGVTGLFTFQAILNMGVAVGLFPTKGLTLPFISAGGTSLLASAALMGILLNVALQAGAPAAASHHARKHAWTRWLAFPFARRGPALSQN